MSKLKLNSEHAQGRKLLLLLMLFLLTPLFIFAQKSVSGVVTSADGEPLIGANVLVKGTDVGTITNIDGSYTLDNVPEDAVIVISFIGYDTQEIGVAGRNDIDVLVTATGVLLDQLVVTGYATERKKDILGAVSVADMDAVRDLSNHSVLQSLAGRVPGLYLDQSGVPGQGAKVRVRGNSTLGNNQPLYIIDGVPLQSFETVGTQTGMAERISQPPVVDLSWLNPNDIESVQVLKDASSASIYGSRASNGVVIITTKQPKEQESRVTFNARFGVENVHYRAPFVTTERGAMLGWQSAVNSGSDPNDASFFDFEWHFDPSLGPGIQGNGVPVLDRVIYTADWLDEANNLRPSGHPQSNLGGTLEEGTNWQDIAYEKGLIQNYDVQFSRGGKKGGVQFSMNFFDQKGVLIGNNFQRLGLRLNSNYKFANEKLTVGQNVAVSRGKRQWGVFTGLGPPPILPPFTEDGAIAGVPPGFTRHDNPLGAVDNDKWDRNNNTKVFGNVYLNWDIIEGLSFRTNVGLDYDNIFIRDIYPTFERGLARNGTGELRQTQLHQTNLVFNNTLTYTKSFNQHLFTVLGGTEYIDNFVTDFQAFAKDFALNTNEYYQFDAATGEKNVGGGTTGFKLFSYFGKVNYSFADKYLASFTVRRDGSSRFGTENRFAVFPAASVGWRIGAEEFMQDVDWLSELKIRVGWGQTGNQDILNEARFRLYRAVYAPPSNFTPWGVGCAQTYCTNAATAYDISNNNTGLLPSGFIATQTENNSLKWETQTELNVGIDFGLLNDRITGSFDVFNKETEGILIVQNQPGTFGDGFSLFTNGADMETKGWELALDYHSKAGRDWRYSIGLIGSHYSDKITSLPEDLYGTYPGNSEQNIVGQSPRQLFGFISTGILETQAAVDAAPQYPGIRVGALSYADLNNDGIISELDQEYQEVNGLPSVEYGMNAQVGWKNFDAAVQIWGMAGRTVAIGGGFIGFGNENLNAWTTVNTDTHVPALGIGGGGVQSQAGGTSYQFRNGSFFKFSQFTLGYTLPQTVTGNMSWLSDLRVYFTLDNIWYMYDKKGANRFPSEPWLLDQINFTPGAGPDAHGRGQGNFESRHPKPLAASIGINIGF